MRTVWLAVAATLGLLVATPAPSRAEGPPPPGPEVKQLGYFVGTWNTTGTMSANPFMPAGTRTSKDTCKWFEGKYALLCRGDGTGPMGPSHSLGIMTWSAEEKVYLYYGVDNSPMAMSTVPRGTLEGDTWTYSDESRTGGQVVRSRYVIKKIDARSYAFRWETQKPDGTWAVLIEGKSTKAKE